MSGNIRRIDASTHTITMKKDGKVTTNIKAKISPDGKVQTLHRSSGGCEEIMVYDRQ